jgi:hypothetical protein
LAALTFFFDRNIGKRLPEALMHLQPPFAVRWHLKEGFAHDMPHDRWMEIVGPKGWIVIGQDWKFHIRENELKAIKQHAIRCFYLPGTGASKWDTYCRIIRSHKRLMDVSKREKPPFIFDLKGNGHLKRVPI